MKKLILVLSAGLVSMNLHASAITLKNLDVVRLNDIQDKSISVAVHYTGKRITGTCSVVVRTDGGDVESFKQLADRFTYKKGESDEITPKTSIARAIVIPLTENLFVDYITISTKDGKSIAENISNAFPGPYNDVGLIAGICP